jgi:hypothetical protein
MTTMTDTQTGTALDHEARASSQSGLGRRAALVVTGLLSLFVPTVFTVDISRMLLTGVETEHRFHQATGQGLLHVAFTLGGGGGAVVAARWWRRIAAELYLSDKTVRNHVSAILGKLEVPDRTDAVLRARRAGMAQT